MTYLRSRLTTTLIASTAVAVLAGAFASRAPAADLQGQHSVITHQTLQQVWADDGKPIATQATANGVYTVKTGASTAWATMLMFDGNRQSAEIAGNAGLSTLTASTVHAEDGDGTVEPGPFALLSNNQVGDNIVYALSDMTISVPGEVGNSHVTISANTNTARARMNDASNTLSLDVVDFSGKSLLSSSQTSTGSVTADAVSHFGKSDANFAVQSSKLLVHDNSTISEAGGNRVLNNVKVDAAIVTGSQPVLDSLQTNSALVSASSDTALNLDGRGAFQSRLEVDHNNASSLAHGNFAENRMGVTAGFGVRQRAGDDTPQLTAAIPAQPVVGAVLSNRQLNSGAVAAQTRLNTGMALNCDCTTDSQSGNTQNSGAASAYGNAALNAFVAKGVAVAMVSNTQENRGPVSATATGRFGASMSEGVSGSMVSISGNGMAAVAIGNQAVNTLTTIGARGAAPVDIPR